MAHFHVEDIQGETPDMIRLKRMARLYAPHGASVWIHGETGTGKELLPQSLHNASPRARYPFVAINCAALPESLLESELFGYAEGAFTGAKRGGKPGVFEMAHKGTLFLDEVGTWAGHPVQAPAHPGDQGIGAGGRQPGHSGGHPGAQRLAQAPGGPGAGEEFQADLFYRLAALRLRVPPLRQRLQDLPLLLGELLRRYGRSLKDLTPAMLDALRAYPWPGNIRELLAFMESYLIVSAGQAADQSLFLELFRSWCSGEDACGAASCVGGPVSSESGLEEDLKDQLNRARLDIARRMLARCGGNRRLAASRLGISYNTLWRILENGAPE
jgi:propionate catabolism operon transcriptional regulator